MQDKLFNSVRAVNSLDETAIFNAVLTDKGLQKWILDLNRSQLFKGENSIGVSLRKIGGGYSFTTEFLNEGRVFTFNPKAGEYGKVEGGSKKKIAGQAPFLFDTFDYYVSYTIKLGNGFFRIDSDPIKDGENLEDRFGDELEGLQDQNLQKLIDVIRKKFIQETRTALAA